MTTTVVCAAGHPLVEARALFAPAVCALVHPPGAECGVCNPVMVDGYSTSPIYVLERLQLVFPSRSVHGLSVADAPRWDARADQFYQIGVDMAWEYISEHHARMAVRERKAHSRLWRRGRVFLYRLGRYA